MHSAPAVSYPVGRSSFHAVLIVSAFLCGSLAGGLWILQGHPRVWMQTVFVLALSSAHLYAAVVWWRTPSGVLRWSGQTWAWTTSMGALNGVVTVHLDVQFCLLLCIQADDGTKVWLVPERQERDVLWRDLRRAVFSRPIQFDALRIHSNAPQVSLVDKA